MRSALLNIVRQAGIEGSEEGVSYAANYIADRLARDPEAKFSVNELIQSIKLGTISGSLFGTSGTMVNSVRNYNYLSGRDGGRTADFDAQWSRYNEAGRMGIPLEQVEAYPSDTPISQDAAFAAHAAGMNDFAAEAGQTAARVLAGETVADSALDKALVNPDSRAQLEQAVGELPKGYKDAREVVWNWQEGRRTEQVNDAQQAAPETQIDMTPETHTPQENAQIQAYVDAVDDGLKRFAQDAIAGEKQEPYTMKPVSDRAAQDIKETIGVDATGFETKFESRMVTHINIRHGKNGTADSSMANVNDIARMQYVIDHYDTMEDGGRVQSYKEPKPGNPSQNRPARSVVYKKR